jgi:hypothetical protein
MKNIPLVLGTLLMWVNLIAQTEEVIKITKVPQSAEKYIPNGYIPFDVISGNLNLDKYPDMIIALKSAEEDTAWDNLENYKRPLLILLGESDRTYKLFTKNDNVLYSFLDKGIVGDPYEEIKITNGSFSIRQTSGGASFAEEQILTFKYSPQNNNWYLFKKSTESWFRDRSKKDIEKKDVQVSNQYKDKFGMISIKSFNNEY